MKMIIANYKMHCGVRESTALARGVLRGVQGKEHIPEIVLCPSFPALVDVRKVVAKTHVMLGAQDVASTPNGAFTGEVSATQLKDVGCDYVLVGHSERREGLGETDDVIRGKLMQAFAASVVPVLCVGKDAITQVAAAFRDVVVPRGERVIVAYEPLSAIGTGNAASVADVVAMHQAIRRAVTSIIADRDVFVLYGGSVDGKNAHDYLRERDVDGVLVGGASVKLAEFLTVIAAAEEVLHAQAV